MMITEATIDAIEKAVLESDFSDAGIASVKQAFPDLRLTYCLLDEMGTKEPYRECDGFSLFLVGSSDHCLGLTNTPEGATGVVIAEDYE